MAKCWRIVHYKRCHEVAQSAIVTYLKWYPVPNQMTSGVERLLLLDDGHPIYACYHLLAQRSSQLPPYMRGWLSDTEGRPFSLSQMCRHCVASESLVRRTLDVLSDTQLQIGWMVEEEMEPISVLKARYERANRKKGARPNGDERRQGASAPDTIHLAPGAMRVRESTGGTERRKPRRTKADKLLVDQFIARMKVAFGLRDTAAEQQHGSFAAVGWKTVNRPDRMNVWRGLEDAANVLARNHRPISEWQAKVNEFLGK